jgi:hypothetical protein
VVSPMATWFGRDRRSSSRLAPHPMAPASRR